ncbi:MAG: FecR family protein [Lachnospiraceae bacterium]|nr:FecR family protein [Lachnospiraceae bacterium]
MTFKQRKLFSKNIVLIVAALLFLLAGCGLSARNILVEAVKGSVTATGKETVAVVKGEKLIAGDEVSTGSDSDLTLLLDSDRHIYAGENTTFKLNAKGKKTAIEMETGRLTIGIDNKLAKKETFDVETSNAVLSVRGTVFTVVVTKNGRNYETNLSVESGAIEVKTVEDGQEKTYTVSGGESKTFTGTAPGKKKDDSKAEEPPKYKRTRTGDGPEVDAIFEDGRIDTFAFNEDYDAFKAENTQWTLDLRGNTIELIKNLELNTDVTVINGTLVTFGDGYVVNKNVCHLGYEKSTDGEFLLWTHDEGVKNSGTLDLRSFKATVDGGVGIENSGKITNEGYDSYSFFNGETEGAEKEITVNTGTFLVNTAVAEEYSIDEPVLGNVYVICNNGCAIENKGVMRVEASEFSGQSDNFVINRKDATLSMYLDLFNVETDGTVGLLNEGYINTNYNDTFFYVDKTGTGVVNKGEINGSVWTHVYNGLGMDNFGKVGRYFGEIEGGLGVTVEKGGDITESEIVIKAGDGMVNHGMIEDTESDYVGNGFDRLHRVLFYVIGDDYTGTALLNDEDGSLCGWLIAYASSVNGGCLIENKGSIECYDMKLAAGLKVTSVERWDAFKTGPESYWQRCEVKYELSPDTKLNNTTLFKDSGDSRFEVFTGVMSGKGAGDVVMWHMTGGGVHSGYNSMEIELEGSNATGLVIDSGTKLACDPGYELGIGIDMGYNPDNPNITMGRYTFPGENCTNYACVNNTGIINNGTIEGTYDGGARISGIGIKSALYGSESTGLLNNGTVNVRRVEFKVGGTQNTGLHNLTSLDSQDCVSGYAIGNRNVEGSLISGGNIGVYNPGIIHADYLISVAGDSGYENHGVTSRTEGKEGKDIGVYNTGTIELYTTSLTPGYRALEPRTYTPAGIGLYSDGYIKAYRCYISTKIGTAMLCDEKSVTYLDSIQISGEEKGLGLMLSGLMEMQSEYTYEMEISGRDGGKGMQITETGSFINRSFDSKGTTIFAAYGEGSVGASNAGHLDIGYLKIVKRDGAKITDALFEHGMFSYKTPEGWSGTDHYYVQGSNGYEERVGCAGPWPGATYDPARRD